MRVTQLEPGNVGPFSNLAASYDKTGQRNKAVAFLQQALDTAHDAGNDQLARQIAERLKLYRQDKSAIRDQARRDREKRTIRSKWVWHRTGRQETDAHKERPRSSHGASSRTNELIP